MTDTLRDSVHSSCAYAYEEGCPCSYCGYVANWRQARKLTDTLTDRQWQVLSLLVQGDQDSRIAETMSFSLSLVKSEVRQILDRLSCQNRTQAAVIGFQAGIRNNRGTRERYSGQRDAVQ